MRLIYMMARHFGVCRPVTQAWICCILLLFQRQAWKVKYILAGSMLIHVCKETAS